MRKILEKKHILILVISFIGLSLGFYVGKGRKNTVVKYPHKMFICHFDSTNYQVIDTFSFEDYRKMDNPPVFVNMSPNVLGNGYVKTPEIAAVLAFSQSEHPYFNNHGEIYFPHFDVYLCDSTWIVEKSYASPENIFGGSYMLEIDKTSGKMLGIIRYK